MRKTMRATPEGTRDLLFEECQTRREAERRLSRLFRRRGFSEVMTPGMEFFDVFQAEDAPMIPADEMYKFTDTKGRLLVMRPDSTMPIARMTATRLQGAPLPLRLYYAQDVYHLHHGLTGRNDQEFQAGVELIGAAGERADLEVIALAAESLELFAGGQSERTRIEIGHVGFFHSLVEALPVDREAKDDIRTLVETKNYAALGDLLDALPPSEEVDALRRLPRLFGGVEVMDRARELCRGDGSREALDHLGRLYQALCRLGLADRVMIDLGLVHRNEYYTGVIFRGYIEGSGETVVSGGRYDALLQRFGSDLPATGFGVNVDALTKSMLDRGEGQPPLCPQVLVHALPGRETDALLMAGELAAEGTVCECSVFDRWEDAWDYARRRGIPKVLAVGEETVAHDCPAEERNGGTR